MQKRGIETIGAAINNKTKIVAMLAPSFIAEFDYPNILFALRKLGFDKVVELTFGAKMINREYHSALEKTTKKRALLISSPCPGIVSTITTKYQQYKKNLAKIDSPMIATAKICKKVYPNHKTCFLSPCNFKKIEAEGSEFVDFVMDYQELRKLFQQKGINPDRKIRTNNNQFIHFDKFYNDYTKIFPLSGGLAKTAHLKGVLKEGQEKTIDGILNVSKFLDNPNKEILFLDVLFCKGGCIGGPCISKKFSLRERKKRLMHYMNIATEEIIPEEDKGIIKRAKGIKFTK